MQAVNILVAGYPWNFSGWKWELSMSYDGACITGIAIVEYG
jgi:hypothetical protein